MVGDDDGLADGHPLADPAGGVGQQHAPAAGGGGGADAVHDGVDAVALVQVRPAEQHQHVPVADGHRADRADVPGDRRRDEAGQVDHRELVRGRADAVRGRPPAGPEHDGDVVLLDPGRRDDRGGGPSGCVVVRGQGVHSRSLGRGQVAAGANRSASAVASSAEASSPWPLGTVSRMTQTPPSVGSSRSHDVRSSEPSRVR